MEFEYQGRTVRIENHGDNWGAWVKIEGSDHWNALQTYSETTRKALKSEASVVKTCKAQLDAPKVTR